MAPEGVGALVGCISGAGEPCHNRASTAAFIPLTHTV